MLSVRICVLLSLGVSILLPFVLNQISWNCSDSDDFTKITQEYHRIVAQGIPGKVQLSDPLRVAEVSGSNNNYNFTLKNIKLYGLRNCSAERLKIDPEHLVFNYRFDCSNLLITKEFEVNGVFGSIAGEDKGEGNITMTDTSFLVYGDLTTVYDEYERVHYQINNFNFKVKVRGYTKILNESYIKGNDEKHKAVYKFIENNSKEAQAIFRPVLMKNLMAKYMENINSFMMEHSIL